MEKKEGQKSRGTIPLTQRTVYTSSFIFTVQLPVWITCRDTIHTCPCREV